LIKTGRSRGLASAPVTAPETSIDPPTISLLGKWRLLQAICGDPSLSPTAKVVAGVLLDCLNCKTRKCCPSLAYLATRIGKKRRVISAAITQLRQRGWIDRRGRRGSSVYDFAFDRLHQDAVRETATNQREGVRETAHLDTRNAAYEVAQKPAHLETGNVESGNRNPEVIRSSYHPAHKTAKGKQRSREARKTRLSEDWQPSENNIAFALQCGLSEQAIPREATKFKNYHIGKGTFMLDWDRAWQNWCIRAVEFAGARCTTNLASRSLVAGLWGQR
jgi:Helix-turn-helix domain